MHRFQSHLALNCSKMLHPTVTVLLIQSEVLIGLVSAFKVALRFRVVFASGKTGRNEITDLLQNKKKKKFS